MNTRDPMDYWRGLKRLDAMETMVSHLQISPTTNNKIGQLYIFYQCYLTPVHLCIMGHIPTECHSSESSFIHMISSCPHVLVFWIEVTDLLLILLHITVPLRPGDCLLGLSPHKSTDTLWTNIYKRDPISSQEIYLHMMDGPKDPN